MTIVPAKKGDSTFMVTVYGVAAIQAVLGSMAGQNPVKSLTVLSNATSADFGREMSGGKKSQAL